MGYLILDADKILQIKMVFIQSLFWSLSLPQFRPVPA